MKHSSLKHLLIMLAWQLFCYGANGAKVNPTADISIAKYHGNRQAAISYTFDDGLLEHYTMVLPRLNEHGIKATFCIVGSKIGGNHKGIPCMTWSQLREMSAQGHEITNHGWQHKPLTRLSEESLRYEIQHNDTVISDSIGVFPRTFVYPGNSKSDTVVDFCMRHRVGTRMHQVSFGSRRDSVWMCRWVQSLIEKGEWGITMTHGITMGYDAFHDAGVLWQHFDYINKSRGKVWLATLHDVSAYVKERDDIRLNIKSKGRMIKVTPKTSLDPKLFNHPLTLIIPDNAVEVIQAGCIMPIYHSNGKRCADINPNKGTVKIFTSPAVVILTAGQSNTDGRVLNEYLPDYIKTQGYKYCKWSYGSGMHSGQGHFEPFYPRIINKNKPGRWAYDAVVYYHVEQMLQRPFYVIKESMGGTAIDTLCRSNSNMHWSADAAYLARTPASDKGGYSLLKAFVDNIGACIDNELAALHGGYDIKAMLWHQGESDRSQAAHYYDNLKALVSYVRSYLVEKTGQKRYARLPFICGTFSSESKLGSKVVVDALRRMEAEDPDFYVVDVSDATLQKDQIHFDASGAELLGQRMFDKLQQLLMQQ